MTATNPISAANARYARSEQAFEQARGLMPGGVSSPVRAFKAVGRSPLFIREGKGCKVTDLDGNVYVDYVGGYGPLILGHAHDAVVEAVSKAASRGMGYGMSTQGEIDLARLVTAALPSVERVRFVNSGTEATMSAIRLARAATGRTKIIKCTGCYHGHSDGLLVEAGSGATTLGTPSSPGIPEAITSQTVLVPYNDLPGMETAFNNFRGQIAGILIEPIAGNMGTVPPAAHYLAGLRALCDKHGALLIFDEVMTGFRVAYGGAQERYGIRPDLTCLGKIVGGGMPCAAYGGRADLMRQISPEGPVYQAGTLSGNPLAMAAGSATLTILRDSKPYPQLEKTAAALEAGMLTAAKKAGVPLVAQRVGSMVTFFLTDKPVTNYQQALRCNTKAYAAFFGVMLDKGVVLPPSQFETWFVSVTHDQSALDQTFSAAEAALAAAAKCS
ncbi:MAG: glutamate-1-semialdehyde 2,1-aminomutase [Phycisphaeraceae bacterium]|nr:glutamate-1-semialdehyde 2,1-aminomutase [Phycisphaeraceae bacterium]